MHDERRTQILSIHLTPDEAAALEALASARGMSPERWIQLAINQAGRTTTQTSPGSSQTSSGRGSPAAERHR